jgi:hypothetical protein
MAEIKPNEGDKLIIGDKVYLVKDDELFLVKLVPVVEEEEPVTIGLPIDLPTFANFKMNR